MQQQIIEGGLHFYRPNISECRAQELISEQEKQFLSHNILSKSMTEELNECWGGWYNSMVEVEEQFDN